LHFISRAQFCYAVCRPGLSLGQYSSALDGRNYRRDRIRIDHRRRCHIGDRHHRAFRSSPFLSSHHKRRRFGSFALLQKKQCRSATTRQSTMSWTASLPLVGDHRGKAPRLIQSANPKGKVGLVATRDLQRFIGDVEGEDLFLFSRQDGHHTDPFSLSLTTVSAKDQIFKNRSWTDARQSITLG